MQARYRAPTRRSPAKILLTARRLLPSLAHFRIWSAWVWQSLAKTGTRIKVQISTSRNT